MFTDDLTPADGREVRSREAIKGEACARQFYGYRFEAFRWLDRPDLTTEIDRLTIDSIFQKFVKITFDMGVFILAA